jgi:hypothetical protein
MGKEFGKQKLLLILDSWSVHLLEFPSWVQRLYPWLVIHYIPAWLTSKVQSTDIGLKKPLKDKCRAHLEKRLRGQVREFGAGIVPRGMGHIREPSFAWFHDAWASMVEDTWCVLCA